VRRNLRVAGFAAFALSFIAAGSGESAPTGATCSYGSDPDGVCAKSRSYVAQPFYSNANVASESAQSGQSIKGRNALIHTGNYDIPYMDFPVGSENPATLKPISTFRDDRVCSYYPSGSPDGHGPYLGCNFSSLAADYDAIRGYDFTNTGGGTGTDCVQLILQGGGAGVSKHTVKIINNYFGVFIQAGSGANYCYNISANTGLGGLVSYKSNAAIPPKLEFDNNTFFGNYYKKPEAATGQANAIVDNRNGVTHQWPITLRYNFFHQLQGISIIGFAGGDQTFIGNAAVDICRSTPDGNVSVHCEIEENVAENVARTDIYERNFAWVMPKPACPGGPGARRNCGLVQWTTLFYETNGAAGNATITTLTMYENVFLTNKSMCSNPPDFGAYPNTAGYGPKNACSDGTNSVGHGIFSLNQASAVGTLNFRGNVIDNSGTFKCAGDPNIISRTGFAAEITSSGNTLTVTSASSNYRAVTLPGPAVGNINVGNFVHDPLGSDGWVDTTVTALNTYTNAGALPAKPGAAPANAGAATPAGIGTMTLRDREPATESKSTWNFYTGIGSITDSGTNYAIASGSARRITLPSLPWGTAVGTSGPDGYLNCP
jgi:hypothetical protein